MGFQQGLSGLNAAAKNLDVIGNNVANANTVGFKQSQAQFADVYANAQGGSSGSAVGIGVRVSTIAQQFGQGNISTTNNPLDLAVSGQGFFQMDVNGAIVYTRNGQFNLDANGYIVNAQGHKLSGYLANPLTGVIQQGNVGPIQLPTGSIPPFATTHGVVGMNLDSRAALPANGTFDPTNPDSYNKSTSMTVYDSLGNNHVATLYFVKIADTAAPAGVPNKWEVHLTIDNNNPNGTSPVTPAASLLGGAGNPLVFNTTGTMTAPPGPPVGTYSSNLTFPAGIASPQTITLDFLSTTQFGSPFSVDTLNQDGYTSGQLNGYSATADGVIMGRYTNGQSKPLGQVLLVNFSNPQGLQPLGNNEWSNTSASGQPLLGVPGTSSLGVLQSGAVEDSNVDLTAELVNMITAQRVYQANAQTIKAQDSIMQTITNLR